MTESVMPQPEDGYFSVPRRGSPPPLFSPSTFCFIGFFVATPFPSSPSLPPLKAVPLSAKDLRSAGPPPTARSWPGPLTAPSWLRPATIVSEATVVARILQWSGSYGADSPRLESMMTKLVGQFEIHFSSSGLPSNICSEQFCFQRHSTRDGSVLRSKKIQNVLRGVCWS